MKELIPWTEETPAGALVRGTIWTIVRGVPARGDEPSSRYTKRAEKIIKATNRHEKSFIF
jgi:hypothetical protein